MARYVYVVTDTGNSSIPSVFSSMELARKNAAERILELRYGGFKVSCVISGREYEYDDDGGEFIFIDETEVISEYEEWEGR